MRKVLLFFLITVNVYSQDQHLINKIFVFNLIQDRILLVKEKSTSRELLNVDQITIGVDYIGYYSPNIKFYRFNATSNSLRTSDENCELLIDASSCSEFVIAYDTQNKYSFRLKGFNGNDFLFLLKSIQMSERKNIKKIISELNYKNIGIDFSCIYKSLKKTDFNSECLKACRDGLVSHTSNVSD